MIESNIPSKLKVSNRRVIYDLLSRNSGISMAELSRMSGISGATTMKIVNFLKERGIADRESSSGIPKESTGRVVGRKPVPLHFNPNFAYCAAICFDGRAMQLGVLNMLGEVIHTERRKLEDPSVLSVSLMEQIINQMIEYAGVSRKDVIGLGLGLPAAVNPTDNLLLSSPFLTPEGGVEKFPYYVEMLANRLDFPIFIENDVNCAAYGEFMNSYHLAVNDLAYISVGAGVGCGLIIDSKIRRGENYFAGEIGSMVFVSDHDHTNQKLGWLESKINLDAVYNTFSIEPDLAQNDDLRHRIAGYISDYLAMCITNISTVLDIKTVVLGGALTDYCSTELLEELDIRLKRMQILSPTIRLRSCKYPDITGLAHIVIQNCIDGLLGADEYNESGQ